MPKSWRVSRVVAIVCAIVVVAGLAAWLFSLPASTFSISLLCFLGAATLIGLAVWISTPLSQQWNTVSSTAQQLVPLLTVAGVFIGTGLYFLERRDKFRFSFVVESSVVRLEPEEGRQRRVLLTLRIPIENKGARRINFRCVSVDVLHPPGSGDLLRSQDSREEMQLRPLSEIINYRNRVSDRCLIEERRRARIRGRATPGRPLFIWPAFSIEPGDVDDRYFEVPVSCDYAFVRVLVKIRISPRDGDVNEAKTVVPLADTCRGEQDSSRGVSTPAIEGAPGEGGGAAIPSSEMTGGNAAL
jgi:hypothetical protein